MRPLTDSQKPDHDLIIELKTGFEIFLKQYHLDMVELKDGYASKMADHELRLQGHEERLRKLENIIESVKLESTVAEFRLVQQQVRDFITTANVYRVVAGCMGGAVLFVLLQVPTLLHTWGILR